MKNRNILFTAMVMTLSAFVVSCSDDDSGMNMAPQLKIGEASATFRYGSTLNAEIVNPDSRSIKESGFIVSASSDFENLTMDEIRKSGNCHVIQTDNVVTTGKMQQTVSGLSANTEYHYCAYVSSGYSVLRSESGTFTTTENNNPAFSAVTVSDITLNSASVSFELLDIGGNDEMQNTWVRYTKTNSTVSDLESGQAVDGSSHNATLYNLDKGSRYAVWVCGITTTGRKGYSDVAYFTTADYNASFSAPSVSTSGTSLTVQTTVTTSEQIVSKGIFYSVENTEPNEKNKVALDETSGNNINVTVSNLSDGLYYVRPFVRISKDGSFYYIYGNVQTVTVSNASLPVLNATEATDITQSSAKVSSSLASDGGITPYEYGFCYVSGTGTPTINDNAVGVPSSKVSNGNFSATITGLTADTDYSVRSYAVNKNGISYGALCTFHTAKNAPSEGDIDFPE